METEAVVDVLVVGDWVDVLVAGLELTLCVLVLLDGVLVLVLLLPDVDVDALEELELRGEEVLVVVLPEVLELLEVVLPVLLLDPESSVSEVSLSSSSEE